MTMICGIGNPVYDIIKTPFIQREGRVLSGCSTNACIVSSQLMTKALLVGCVGDDYKKETEKVLNHFGVEPVLYPSQQTGGFSLLYDHAGNRELTVIGRADNISEVPERASSADIIFLGPILQEIPPSLVETLSKNNSLLFCDLQGFLRDIKNGSIIHIFPQFLKEILPLFDIIKPNEPEAYTMTGKYASEHPHEVMETLYSYGPSICIVTLAEKGSLVYDGEELIKIPAFQTEANDPTGAGDTYAAGFMVKYLQSKNLYESGLFASCTASLWVESVGPCITITHEKVNERVEKLKRSEK
ncbi:MAG: bifunctional hydroxymethylpyrimidine kinase/phosphomethylpyrimidine kinase [Theionarchaea archaeon]|nr:bifunctional hydroxymethylpyrimidine kinase/phosphomethylpyrimidine kinase [Theionarchaea archaeon]